MIVLHVENTNGTQSTGVPLFHIPFHRGLHWIGKFADEGNSPLVSGQVLLLLSIYGLLEDKERNENSSGGAKPGCDRWRYIKEGRNVYTRERCSCSRRRHGRRRRITSEIAGHDGWSRQGEEESRQRACCLISDERVYCGQRWHDKIDQSEPSWHGLISSFGYTWRLSAKGRTDARYWPSRPRASYSYVVRIAFSISVGKSMAHLKSYTGCQTKLQIPESDLIGNNANVLLVVNCQLLLISFKARVSIIL